MNRKESNPKPKHKTKFEIVKDYCDSWGKKYLVILGDGNCLFRCLAHEIDGDVENHMRIREEVCHQLILHRQYYMAQFDNIEWEFLDYVEGMQQDGHYGDHHAVAAACDLYNMNIIVYEVNEEFIQFKAHDLKDDVIVGYNDALFEIDRESDMHHIPDIEVSRYV